MSGAGKTWAGWGPSQGPIPLLEGLAGRGEQGGDTLAGGQVPQIPLTRFHPCAQSALGSDLTLSFINAL